MSVFLFCKCKCNSVCILPGHPEIPVLTAVPRVHWYHLVAVREPVCEMSLPLNSHWKAQKPLHLPSLLKGKEGIYLLKTLG